jgi:hypothetical protein
VGFSESGIMKFSVYGDDDYVEVTLPDYIENEDMVGAPVDIYMNSTITYNDETSFTLKDFLTSGSAYLKLVCPYGMEAFYGTAKHQAGDYAYKLREISFEKGVKVIKPYSFQGLTGITKVTFPENLQEIEEDAFVGCTNLHFDVLEIGNFTIGAHAFADVKIDTLRLVGNAETGDTVVSAETGPFYGANIKKIEVADDVNFIPPYLFAGAYFTAEEHNYLNDITVVSEHAFEGCYDLTVWLSDAIWVMDDSAFLNCKRLHAHVQVGSEPYQVFLRNNIEFEEYN